MESIVLPDNICFINDNIEEPNINKGKISGKKSGFSPAILNMVARAGINFFRYLKSIGLAMEPNLIILSSKHHYNYDENELKSVRTLINLKKLNLIKHLDMFLYSLIRILPENTNFIGCFSDNKTLKGNVFPFCKPSRLFHIFLNLFDSRPDHKMDKNEVSEVLERNGFRVVDMKEINGLTYFYSQNVQ